jgi:hypothetical protein
MFDPKRDAPASVSPEAIALIDEHIKMLLTQLRNTPEHFRYQVARAIIDGADDDER